jgi:hypothetical protein
MTVNNRTSSRDYAKPNVANLLSEDVVRLSEALDSIDTDVAALQSKAPLASPALTGTPSAPTAAIDTNTTQVATTAFVLGQASAANPVINGTAAVGSSLRFARADHIHPTDTTRAPVASPTFTGAPAAPTPAVDTSTTQLATTAFVIGQDYTKQTRMIFAGTGLTGGGDLGANRTISADVATQAEAEAGTSSTKLMTPQRTLQTLQSNSPIPPGTVMLFQQNSAPTGWTKLTTHDNKALRVVSGTAGTGGSAAFTSVFASRTPAGSVYGSNSGGGVHYHTLSWNEMPSHNHLLNYLTPAQNNDTDRGAGSSTFSIDNVVQPSTQHAGGSWGHTHGFSPSSWSGSFSGSAMDFAVAYVDVIFASKN